MTQPTQPPPEATFSDRTNTGGEQYVPPEFTPEPVPPLPEVGPSAPSVSPDSSAGNVGPSAPSVSPVSSAGNAETTGSGETIYRRNSDGSYSAVTVRAEDAPVEMPTWNHYVHTASGKVFQVMDPPIGPRHLDDETGESHQIIGVYPR
jgi:hypothetical protein